ncbi:MAG: Toxin co-regulated pilus biosynthesis protein [Gammaproteobacteria bacterium]|jgi:hypothetical protein|nr:Toxin co-regulated pilus biosynthesis protein [Gammaproteobacteria bacterium]
MGYKSWLYAVLYTTLIFNSQTILANQASEQMIDEASSSYSKISPSPKKLILSSCKISRKYVTSTSLKSVITDLISHCGWKTLVWDFDFDYHLAGDVTIQANNIADALGQLLVNYPLQAVFYDGNKVVKMQPRRD